MKSKITYRDRAVEAIARALEWVKEEGNSYPYKIAFVAEEPHCIVSVEGIRMKKGDSTSYMFYRIDGGPLKKMEHRQWMDLWDEYRFGPKEYESAASLMNDDEHDEEKFYGPSDVDV